MWRTTKYSYRMLRQISWRKVDGDSDARDVKTTNTLLDCNVCGRLRLGHKQFNTIHYGTALGVSEPLVFLSNRFKKCTHRLDVYF